MHGEPVGEPRSLGGLGDREREHHHRLVGEPEPPHRLERPRAALERGRHQVGPQPPRHVRACPDAQQVQRHQVSGVAHGPRPVRCQWLADRGPDRAEHLIARPDGHRGAWQREVGQPGARRVDVDRLLRAVQLAEHATLGEQPRVPFRHLPAEDRLHPGQVRLVLPPGEREHPRGAVLDGDWRVDQRRDRVGDREQVTGREPAERLRAVVPDVALGEQRPQQRRELRPRRAACQPEQRHARRLDRGGHRLVAGDRGADDEPRRVVLAEGGQQRGDGGRLVHPDTEHERPARQHRLVERVVDRHPAHVAGSWRGGGLPDKLEQRRTEILEDAVQAWLRANCHATKLPADLPVMA